MPAIQLFYTYAVRDQKSPANEQVRHTQVWNTTIPTVYITRQRERLSGRNATETSHFIRDFDWNRRLQDELVLRNLITGKQTSGDVGAIYYMSASSVSSPCSSAPSTCRNPLWLVAPVSSSLLLSLSYSIGWA